jgi:hypothetical protein
VKNKMMTSRSHSELTLVLCPKCLERANEVRHDPDLKTEPTTAACELCNAEGYEDE